MNVRLFLCMCEVKHEMTFEVAAELLGVCIDVKTTVKISVTKRFFFHFTRLKRVAAYCRRAYTEGRQTISYHFIILVFFLFLHKSFLTAAIWWSHYSHKCCLASQCEDTSIWIILTRNGIHAHIHIHNLYMHMYVCMFCGTRLSAEGSNSPQPATAANRSCLHAG